MSHRIERDRAGELFSPLGFNDADALFYLAPNAVGFGFLCTPMPGVDSQTLNRINVVLNQDWPKDTILQFVLVSGPDIAAYLHEYVNGATNDTFKEFRSTRASFLEERTERPLGNQRPSDLCVRNQKVIVTVRVPASDGPPSARLLESLHKLQSATHQTLSNAGLAPQRLTPGEYLRALHPLLNRHTTAQWRAERHPEDLYDPEEPIGQQVLEFTSDLQVDRHGITIGADTRVRFLSPKRLPRYGYMGMAQRFLVEPLTGHRGIRDPAIITASIHFPDPQSTRASIDAKRKWVVNQGVMARVEPRLHVQKESLDILTTAIGNGDRPVRLYLGMALFVSRETEHASVANAITYWRELGFQLLEDDLISLPLFLHMLPFGAEPEVAFELQRYKTVCTQHAAVFLPIVAQWRGTQTNTVLLVGRDGQTFAWDMFDSKSNFNTLVCSKSGAGKSYLVNEIILSYLTMNGRCWIIDVGRSYEKLCETLGGQFMAFSRDRSPCMNPFELVEVYEEEADMLATILSNMAAPTERLSDLQTSELRRVLGELWVEHGRATTVDLVAAALKRQTDRRVRDVGLQLFAFTSEGEYGRYFNGPNTVQFNGHMTVLELEELKNQRHLQQVVLQIMIYQIQQNMYLGRRDRRKILFIDEAYDLLTGDATIARFIEVAFRRFRKYGGACVVITQSISDMYQTAGGVAMVENSAHKLLLSQSAESVGIIEREGRLQLGSAGYEFLRSVRTDPGEYSEILVKSDDIGLGIARLYVEPVKLLLYSTRAEDVEAIRAKRQDGLSLAEAIRSVLQDRGIYAGRAKHAA